ncbi:MAG: Xaa-Pro peptidase family protein [Chloroflexi bacterium]|nr:Xaa-Pro peptidase family protein [Chloroflexota bacterium]MCC6895309.1 aminopeptidase P family protein [Anaerolineae bacterium]
MTIQRLSEAFYRRKIGQIQARMEAAGLDGMLLLDVPNVIYACGFFHTPSERPLGLYIPKSGEVALFVPLLELENAGASWVKDIRTYFEYPGETHPVEWMVQEAGAKRLGIDTLTVDVYQRLGGNVTVTPMVEQMRWIKEPEELALIEKAATYADTCLEYVLENAGAIIRDGGTELDILRACIGATAAKMKAEVGEIFNLRSSSVVGTVHSGPRAALPHGSPIERKPQIGEPMIAGIGASVGGYHAESGATFVIGEPKGDVMRCLEAAMECDLAGIKALRVGNTCTQVNEAALGVLREYGLGDAIRHRIGHGMGLQGHEGPWLAPGDNTPLVAGMVFSNEPGIYRPEIDGYRLIDSMIVTDGEAKVPSRFLANHPPEKRIIPI